MKQIELVVIIWLTYHYIRCNLIGFNNLSTYAMQPNKQTEKQISKGMTNLKKKQLPTLFQIKTGGGGSRSGSGEWRMGSEY